MAHQIFDSIKHSPILHRILSGLRINRAVNSWLSKHPVRGLLPKNTRYRVKAIESFSVRDEILRSPTYSPAFKNARVETFIDLGCNTGYFPCLLREHFSGSIRGLCVDADPEMVAETRWHIQENKLDDVHTLWGIAGEGGGKPEAEFHIHPYNISSTAVSGGNRNPVSRRPRKTISVPVLDLPSAWRQHFADKGVDLLKIDIEGREIDFINQNKDFLKNVKTIVIEWHKWLNELGDLTKHLNPLGFHLEKILKEDSVCGIAFFRKEKA